ncbi:MAG: N-acetylmuramoyl-L-alanine amidase [Cyclobacteriaceae bacterium]|nr:N-acetylmuramoyl-L-alanine amidase [Cyclobacteriaceae bacterium]
MQGTIFFLFSVGQIACSPEIVQMPIPFDEERITLSLEYLQERYGIEKESPKIDPVMVVVHWTAINSLQDSYHAFEGTRLPGFREAIRGASPLNVSAHFLIDREGTIYRLMPDTLFARHVIGLNHCAIGIENIGSDENPLTDKQMKSNLFLIRQLHRTYDIQYVIGHHEYTSFKGHPLWKEVDPDYITIKTDPGDEFMKRLRKKLSSLNIKGPPE